MISIDEFSRMELRVGEILTAERVPRTDKLLRFTIDLGEPEPRQILAGLAAWYEPETLLGRRVIVVANLQPRMLRGLESRGMVLAGSVEGEQPILATMAASVPNGTRLR